MVDSLKEQEEQLLAIQSIPLRNYLIKYVFPTLTQGLIEVANVHPENPIDYLVSIKHRIICIYFFIVIAQINKE